MLRHTASNAVRGVLRLGKGCNALFSAIEKQAVDQLTRKLGGADDACHVMIHGHGVTDASQHTTTPGNPDAESMRVLYQAALRVVG